MASSEPSSGAAVHEPHAAPASPSPSNSGQDEIIPFPDDFPADILLHIASFLTLGELVLFSNTSHHHRNFLELSLLSRFREDFTRTSTFNYLEEPYGWRARLDGGKSIAIYQGLEKEPSDYRRPWNLVLVDFLYTHLLITGYEGEESMERKVQIVFGQNAKQFGGKDKGGLFALKFLYDYMQRTNKVEYTTRSYTHETNMYSGLWRMRQKLGKEFDKRETEMMRVLMNAASEPVDYLDEALDEDLLERIVEAGNLSAMKVLVERNEVNLSTMTEIYDTDFPCLMELALRCALMKNIPDFGRRFEFARTLAEWFPEALDCCRFNNDSQALVIRFKQMVKDEKIRLPLAAHIPEVTMMIASHLEFEDLRNMANCSKRMRRTLKPMLLQKWFENYKSECTRSSIVAEAQDPGWRGKIPGKYIKKEEEYGTEGPGSSVRWAHWLIWFLVVSCYEGVESVVRNMKEAVRHAFSGDGEDAESGGLYATNVLIALNNLQSEHIEDRTPGSPLEWRYRKLLRNTEIGYQYRQFEACLVKQLIEFSVNTEKKRRNFAFALVQDIVPNLFDRENLRFVKTLIDVGFARVESPMERLHERGLRHDQYLPKAKRVSELRKGRHFAYIEALLSIFPTLISDGAVFDRKVEDNYITVDLPSFVCKLAYDWLMRPEASGGFPWVPPNRYAAETVEDDGKGKWREVVRSLLKKLHSLGFNFNRALKFCLADFICDEDEWMTYERIPNGMGEMALWMIKDFGADPNVILPQDQDQWMKWSPLHPTGTGKLEKEMFYTFLNSDYQGYNTADEERATPALQIVINIVDWSSSEEDSAGWYELLEALLKRRPQCLDHGDWDEVVDIVEKERAKNSSPGLVRIFDEAVARRAELANTVA
ncbi:hypothetical protein BJ508DRAFT_413360 [Ascobolus immersus RN42]|uniref:F-box domain-containing protein n=1 Tax=Ascobolus immersus RN42 TaxID=1160509 RepID=A0A3N4IHT0_ASCIM|nr:hypothetical protein BJ508DRAFT_413360 [Ascobolus immersus RN42]